MKPQAVQKYDKVKQRRIKGCVGGSVSLELEISFSEDRVNLTVIDEH